MNPAQTVKKENKLNMAKVKLCAGTAFNYFLMVMLGVLLTLGYLFIASDNFEFKTGALKITREAPVSPISKNVK